MSSETPSHGADSSTTGSNYLTAGGGLFSTDHKRIGLNYLWLIVLALLAGGVMGLLTQVEQWSTGKTIVDQDGFRKLFTAHGLVMIFLFLVPGIPATLGNFFLPLMLGAKNVIFPRLNLLAFWMWLGGAALLVLMMADGSFDSGWTFHPLYAGGSIPSLAALGGVFLLGLSSILTSVNFLLTMHCKRPQGMNWMRMPLFLWGLYAASAVTLLATPVLGLTLLLLAAEQFLGIGIFNQAMGGNPVLYQHLFWFYAHPAIFSMVLPGLGVASEVLAVHSRRCFGACCIAISMLTIAFLGFAAWGSHMFTSGQSGAMSVMFSLLTLAVSVPLLVVVFNWLATLHKGAIRLSTAMCYGLGMVWLVTVGILSGLFRAALSTGVHVQGTSFDTGYLHYFLGGTALFGLLAGLHHWWPKMYGRMAGDGLGRLASLLLFVGFNLAFFPSFLLGGRGMPERFQKIGRAHV